jgi:hypothetical protein
VAAPRTRAALRLETCDGFSRVWADVTVDDYTTPVLLLAGSHHRAEAFVEGKLYLTADSRLVDRGEG